MQPKSESYLTAQPQAAETTHSKLQPLTLQRRPARAHRGRGAQEQLGSDAAQNTVTAFRRKGVALLKLHHSKS